MRFALDRHPRHFCAVGSGDSFLIDYLCIICRNGCINARCNRWQVEQKGGWQIGEFVQNIEQHIKENIFRKKVDFFLILHYNIVTN